MESEKRLMKGDRSLDPWDPCVIIGVSLGPTLSEVEDAFALFSASNHETAYQRRKKEDAYVYLKWQLRTCGKGNAVKPTEPTTRKVELVDYKDTSSNLSPTFSTEANSKAGSFTSVSPSFARSNRFSTSSEVTTATTTTVADGGYTTRNSSVQTLKYQSDPEGSRRKSKFYTGKSKPKKPKLRGTRSTTGSSSSVGSQVSDSSTYGTRETLAAISDILQEHTKTLGNSGDSAGKNESVLRGVFRFLRRSRIGSGTSDDNISQPLAGLVLKFQQVESILDRSDTDTCTC